MNKTVKGFMDFVKEQGVVGLAVGLAIGTSAGKAVEAIVEGFINPIVGFILGGSSLESESLTLVEKTSVNGRELVIGWGAIVSGIITLLATAFVIYYVVKAAKLDKLDKKKD